MGLLACNRVEGEGVHQPVLERQEGSTEWGAQSRNSTLIVWAMLCMLGQARMQNKVR